MLSSSRTRARGYTRLPPPSSSSSREAIPGCQSPRPLPARLADGERRGAALPSGQGRHALARWGSSPHQELHRQACVRPRLWGWDCLGHLLLPGLPCLACLEADVRPLDRSLVVVLVRNLSQPWVWRYLSLLKSPLPLHSLLGQRASFVKVHLVRRNVSSEPRLVWIPLQVPCYRHIGIYL